MACVSAMKVGAASALFLILCGMVFVNGCTSSRPELWIYTSIYKEVIQKIEGPLQKAFPDIQIHWYQSGSETVASRLGAEVVAGKPRADLLLTSDPFWYQELKQLGLLLNHASAAAQYLPSEYVDPDAAFATVRLPVMVIGYNSQLISQADAPQSWNDLLDSRWQKKISMPNPMESGSAFSLVAILSRALGWEFFKTLRQRDVLAAGGNSSVVTRIETGERPIGILLLENILKVKKKGSKIAIVYPKEGVVPIASPIAVLKTSRHPEMAKKVYDWFLGEQAQKAIVSGFMYSFHPGAPTPEGGRSLKDLSLKSGMTWNSKVLFELFSQRDAIKSRFSEIVLE